MAQFPFDASYEFFDDPDSLQSEYESDYTSNSSECCSNSEPVSPLCDTESDVPVAVTDDSCITTTNFSNLRAVIQVQSHYDGSMHISNWLKNFKGLIIMPLECISFIRNVTGKHKKDPQILLYMPNNKSAHSYPDFEEAIEFLYK